MLYLDGQRPREIALVAAAILALLATLVVIAPRLHVPEEDAVARSRYDEPTADDTTRLHGDVPPERPAGPELPAATTAAEPVSPEYEDDVPARSASPGRRGRRGRRRR